MEGDQYEFVDIEMGKGEHKKGGKFPTPNQKVPMMVLADGTRERPRCHAHAATPPCLAHARSASARDLSSRALLTRFWGAAAAVHIELAESVAICRYVEESSGADAPRLFGRTPLEKATIEMWNRRTELELMSGGVGKAWGECTSTPCHSSIAYVNFVRWSLLLRGSSLCRISGDNLSDRLPCRFSERPGRVADDEGARDRDARV